MLNHLCFCSDINDFMEVDASLQSGVSDDDQFEVTKTTNELLLSFPAQTYMEMLEEALLQVSAIVICITH